MLIADGGGGGGGTAWTSKSVETMLLLIKSADTDKHYELLTGWKQSADLINEHRWQVKNYRDNLAAAWPPETNAAAEAYVGRLDELIVNLDETYEAAIANHDAFATATLSISLAQKDMQKIADEYAINNQLLQDFAVQQQEKASSPTPTPSPSPSGGEQPPVATGRQEELHRQAVVLLSGVSGELATAQMSIRTPTPYKPGGIRDDTGGGEGGGFVAPPIPPITPSFATDTSSSTASKRPSVTFPTSPSTLPASAPQPPAPQPGLVLGSAPPVVAAPPTVGISPLAPAVPGGTPGPGLGLLPPTTPNTFIPAGSTGVVPPTTGVGRNAGLPREGLIRPGGPTPGGMHVLPPGGMIGGAPGIGIGQPGSARPGTQRVNPIGGVIGGGTSPTKGGGAHASSQHPGASSTVGQPAGRGVGKRSQEEQSRWDPDNPWQTASGVDPVVLPSREQRIDPGPAIGLS